MAKAKKTAEQPAEEIIMDERPYLIKDATIKDGFCNYSYEILRGIGIGDSHTVKGSGVIEDDMRTAFSKLNVHLAAIDDIFKHSNVEVENINTMHGHELATLYNVTGFKIKGGKDDESIILVGNKYVGSAGGRIELETPKIPLDNASSYKFAYEMKVASDEARKEVGLYKEGKYVPVEEDDDEKEGAKQAKMEFPAGGSAAKADDNHFEEGKVD